MKASRIALVVIEVEASPGEDKADIMAFLNSMFTLYAKREIEVAAMKIFGADEARLAPRFPTPKTAEAPIILSYPLEYMAADEWHNTSRDKRRLVLSKLNLEREYENRVWAKLPQKARFLIWGFFAGRVTRRLQDDLE